MKEMSMNNVTKVEVPRHHPDISTSARVIKYNPPTNVLLQISISDIRENSVLMVSDGHMLFWLEYANLFRQVSSSLQLRLITSTLSQLNIFDEQYKKCSSTPIAISYGPISTTNDI